MKTFYNLYFRLHRTILFLACFCLVHFTASSQDFNNYQYLESEGKIPRDFLTLSSELYQLEREQIAQDRKRRDKLTEEKFYLESSFELRDLLYSGKILFNDPVSRYLSKVADSLFANDKELRQKLRIYAVKSAHVNAFATNSGMILINLGLLAQLETEAQLAFIIAHEAVHFKNKHVLDNYVETEKIIKGKGMYRNVSIEEKLLAKNNYSKEKESEADLLGIEIFMKSGYSSENLLGVFDVLQYSYLPFDDKPFTRNFFETENLIFPEEYFLENVQSITVPEDENDSKSTHPSIAKRRAYILTKIDRRNNEGKKDFLNSKEEFLNIRQITRYEIAHIYITNLNYEKAIYHTYLLLQDDPDNKYLNKMMVKALYGLTKYYNAGKKHVVHTSYQDIEGESQQVFHLLHKLKSNELNVLALKYSWKLNKKFPYDSEIKEITEDLMRSLVFEHFESRTEFSSVPKAELMEATVSLDSADIEKLSKYDKIKLKQIKEKAEEEKNFIYFGLVENMQDNDFTDLYDKYSQEKLQEKNKSAESYQQRSARIQREKREAKLKVRKGEALGLDKIVVFNTFYLKYDARKNQKKRYIQSEAAEISLNDKISENCRLAGLQFEFIDDLLLTDADVRKFNDLSFLTAWMMERFQHIENDVKMVNLDAETTNKLAQTYGTDYFYWLGFVNTTIPDKSTYHFGVIFNMKKGLIDKIKLDKIKGRDPDYLLNAVLYDSFYQIKRKKTK